MWPIPRIQDETIACIFTPSSISISYLTPHKNRIRLNGYQRILFSNAELEQSIVCNPTQIKQILCTFIAQHNAQHATVHFALRGPSIHEKISNKKTSIKTAQQAYLYTHDNNSIHYTTQISPAVIMQYQLIAIAARIHLLTITTPFIAQLKLYLTVQGTAFRHTQLAHDLRTHNHRIENTFADDTIQRLLDVPSHVILDLANERYFLLSSLGLFYLRRKP